MLDLSTPQYFFYELMEESKSKHNLKLREEVQVYVIDLLSRLINNDSIILDEPISISYLKACQNKDKTTLRSVGDSCLVLLGCFPTTKSTNRTLYSQIGPTSYEQLNRDIYEYLSVEFHQAVNLLLGMNASLNRSTKHASDLWQVTHNDILKNLLRKENILVLK